MPSVQGILGSSQFVTLHAAYARSCVNLFVVVTLILGVPITMVSP